MSGCYRADIDRYLDALNHPLRRQLIYHLKERGSIKVDEAKELVGGTPENDVVRGSKPDFDTLGVELHHQHLPKLADSGIIAYDLQSDLIRYTAPRGELNVIIDLLQTYDEKQAK